MLVVHLEASTSVSCHETRLEFLSWFVPRRIKNSRARVRRFVVTLFENLFLINSSRFIYFFYLSSHKNFLESFAVRFGSIVISAGPWLHHAHCASRGRTRAMPRILPPNTGTDPSQTMRADSREESRRERRQPPASARDGRSQPCQEHSGGAA